MRRGLDSAPAGFAAAAQRVVDYLEGHTPITDWSVTRVAGGEQIHLHVKGEDLFAVGNRVPWEKTQCKRMIGGADQIVSDTLADPNYRDVELSQRHRAYAGVPISGDDGSMFGVLCGVRATPLDLAESVDSDLLALFSHLLGEQLRLSGMLDAGQRELAKSDDRAIRDKLTGLLNRRGWDRLVDDARLRVEAFGDLVAVAVLDLDGLKACNDQLGHAAGDELIRRAGAVLRDHFLDDQVARYGGDEFAVLAEGLPLAEVEQHFGGARAALADAGISASLGCAPALPGAGIDQAFALADARMYEAKRGRAGLLSA